MADDDDSLSKLLEPFLELLEPFLAGLNGGVQAGSQDFGNGFDQIGSAISSVTNGVGNAVANTMVGVGGATKVLPVTLYKTVNDINKEVTGNAVNEVTG